MASKIFEKTVQSVFRHNKYTNVTSASHQSLTVEAEDVTSASQQSLTLQAENQSLTVPRFLESLEDRNDEITEVEEYLATHHKRHIAWHISLNNHAAKRPNEYGGNIVESVEECKHFVRDRSNGTWRCTLRMPNSCEPNDGLKLEVVGIGRTKDEASNNACRRAMAEILWTNAAAVVLRPVHWLTPLEEIVGGLPYSRGLRQALPVHTRGLSAESGIEIDGLSDDERDERVSDILRRCLVAHGGTFDPAKIDHNGSKERR